MNITLTKKIYLLPIAIICIFVTSEFTPKKITAIYQTESWQNMPDSTTTKIKLITSQTNFHQLKVDFIAKVLALHFDVDNSTTSNQLNTTVISYPGYNLKFTVSFQDSVAIVNGNVCNIEKKPSIYHWAPITYSNGYNGGWVFMQSIASYPNSQVLYNSTISK